MRKLNIGCGLDLLGPKSEWLNIDIQAIHHSRPDVDFRVGNLLDLWEVTGAELFDEVRASHVLEHIGLDSISNVLHQCNGVLQIGGSMKIVFPDFGQAAEMYKEEYLSEISLVKLEVENVTVKSLNKLRMMTYLMIAPNSEGIGEHKTILTPELLAIVARGEGIMVWAVRRGYPRNIDTTVVLQKEYGTRSPGLDHYAADL